MDNGRGVFPWRVYGTEVIGTALLIAGGLSVVIMDFGTGSMVIRLVPDAGLRRIITGFLFGTIGALIALSPLGRESGAHINPVVTLGFWLMGKLRGRYVPGYVLSQLAGALIGSVPLLFWGQMGRSVKFGATVPGAAYGTGWAIVGETATTFCMIAGLFFFLRHRVLRRYTPALLPVLYAVMVFVESPLSGTSTNPARTFGPAVVSGEWQAWWVYWAGPVAGMLISVLLYRYSPLRAIEIEVAKLYHFEHDRYGLFGLRKRGMTDD
jgi:aquaporin Z